MFSVMIGPVHKRCITAFLISSFIAAPANSGAWLREKGSGFTSVTVNAKAAQDFSQTSFFEYGVRDDLTLGLEIGLNAESTGAQSGFATFFLRRPIGKEHRANVWAYELGMGGGWDGDSFQPYLKTGLSWGKGFNLCQVDGWMAIDASIVWIVYSDDQLAKFDVTAGLNLTERVTGMVQVFHANIGGTGTTSFAPSIIIKPFKDRPNIHFQIGGEMQIGDTSNSALKVALWREF